jgi:hypothetical protein
MIVVREHISLSHILQFLSYCMCKQLERRKQEDELKRVRQQEEHFQRVKVRIANCLIN